MFFIFLIVFLVIYDDHSVYHTTKWLININFLATPLGTKNKPTITDNRITCRCCFILLERKVHFSFSEIETENGNFRAEKH